MAPPPPTTVAPTTTVRPSTTTTAVGVQDDDNDDDTAAAPRLSVELDDGAAAGGTVTYTVVTETGAMVSVDSDDDRLRHEFAANDERTTVTVDVDRGNYDLVVTAAHAGGAASVADLTVDVGAGADDAGSPLGGFLVLTAAGGGLAYWKRDRLRTWVAGRRPGGAGRAPF
jgi:hypothetical protein